MKKYLLFFLLFISFATLQANWWNGCFETTISAETLISWWGDENAPSRQAFREHLIKKQYGSVLDVGCGLCTDYFGLQQASIAIDYQGLEFTPKFVDRAVRQGIKVSYGNSDHLPFQDEQFDLSYMRFVLEHLPSYNQTLNEMIRVAKKEVLITFFIKPHPKERDRIQRSFDRGYDPFHNSYSQSKLEASLQSHPRVDRISWQEINEQEVCLHVFLKPKSECPAESIYLTKERNLSLVVVIPSYKNSSYVEKNLLSVFQQNYPHWRMIYIDDCSPDDTYEKAQKIIAEHSSEKCTLIKNDKRCGALENLYRAIHSCKDEEVIVTLDGDDWFPHENVLSLLNTFYQDPFLWMTYGSYVDYPSGHRGVCAAEIPTEVFLQSHLRHYGWVSSHLRTFYAGLFKKIALQDLLYKGHCYPMTWDQAIMFPMLEMSLEHAQFIPDILYVYNMENPLNDNKVNWQLQQSCERAIRTSPAYSPLFSPPWIDQAKDQEYHADLVVFSFNRPLQLYAFLESLFKYATHFNRVSVIYRSSDESYSQAYNEVKKTFPQVRFYQQSNSPHTDFQPLVLQVTFDPLSKSDFVAFAVDDIVIKDFVDFKECALAMEKTQAYGFYLRLAPHVDYCYPLNIKQGIPPLISINQEIHAWQFEQGFGDWQYPHSVDLTLYKKNEIEHDLREMSYIHPNSLEGQWARRAPLKKIGLCYDTTKMVNLPLNIVNLSENRHTHSFSAQELLQKFQEGKKLDISPLFQIKNTSAHMDYEPTFIKRLSLNSVSVDFLDF